MPGTTAHCHISLCAFPCATALSTVSCVTTWEGCLAPQRTVTFLITLSLVPQTFHNFLCYNLGGVPGTTARCNISLCAFPCATALSTVSCVTTWEGCLAPQHAVTFLITLSLVPQPFSRFFMLQPGRGAWHHSTL